MGKGIAFTIDAILALLIVLALIPIVALLTSRSPAPQTSSQYLHLQAEDAIDVLSKTKIRDVRYEPVIASMFNRVPPALTEEDLNSTLLDVLGSLSASQTPQDLGDAANITKALLGGLISAELKWSFIINGSDTIYNSTVMNATNFVSASRKAASGFARNRNSTGFVARAFLENILGKEDNAYFFFGGFVGEGNLTATITDVPINSTINKIYLEVNSESNFLMCLNGNSSNCKLFNVSGGNFSVNNWTILSNDSFISGFTAGGMNNFTFVFPSANITKQYFGGGYLRVTYTTSQLIPYINGTMRYRFPGIDGLVNLYDSFYVPGNITSMNALIRLYSFANYTTLGLIGNTTFLNHTGNNQTESITINNANFTALFAANGITYVDLSQNTMPLRFLTGANITGGKLNGTVDVVLITDVSGSMAWQMDSGSSGNNIVDCNNPAVYSDPNTNRISVARCLDKDFINAILGGNTSACGGGTPLLGNRVAIVNFSTSAVHNTSLQNGGTANLTYLTNMINGYVPSGSTCVSCAINRAWEILKTQSSPARQKYVIVMTDGQTNQRSIPTTTCSVINGVAASNTGGYSSMVVQNNGNVSRRTGNYWGFQGTLTTQHINAISMLNSTYAFAAANAGEIYFWNGNSWALSQDVGGSNLNALDMWNDTFGFAVGANGEIYGWNGANWAVFNDTGTQTWYSVTIANGSWAFAGTTSGQIWAWKGLKSNWEQHVDLGGQVIYSLDGWNSTLALAGTDADEIYRWNGGNNWFRERASSTPDIRGISFANSTLAFASTSTGRIYRWIPTPPINTTTAYTLPNTNDPLKAIAILNSSEGYAVGGTGRIVMWNGNSWIVTAFLAQDFEGNTSGTSNSCGTDGSYENCANFFNQSYASMNAMYSADRIFKSFSNVTIDSVGFGPLASCLNANQTLEAIAEAGNGTFYTSTNASELRNIYCQIALNINTKTTATQEITFSGNLTRATLYPESYIEFQYTPAVPAPEYKVIQVTSETDTFPGCNGSFFIPPSNIANPIVDAKMTSYSGNYWTSGAYVNSSATSGFKNVFNLTSFNLLYTDMGDPFHVYLPVSLLKTDEFNYVKDELGLNKTFTSQNCSTFNRVIYTSRLKASTSYGNIYPNLKGKNVTIYYDNNHDGIEDGSTNVAFGADLPLCTPSLTSNCFDPAPVDVASLLSCSDPNGDAMDCAILTLLIQLNYFTIPSNSGNAGESTNPIDIIIGGEVNAQANVLQLVPNAWGPVDMTISVWV
ncbi:MAG: vWA domain-containing protein [Candidatus Micrarchaeota archaeon]